MKKILSLFLLTSFLVTIAAQAEVTQDTIGTNFVTRANNTSPLEGIGTILNRTKNMMVVVWDFATAGGAASTNVQLVDDQGNAATLPYGSIVQSVAGVVLTGLSGPTSAVVQLSLLTSADMTAALAKSSLTSGAFFVGKPLGGASAGLWVGPVTASAGTRLQLNVNASGTTGGKIKFFIEYVIQ